MNSIGLWTHDRGFDSLHQDQVMKTELKLMDLIIKHVDVGETFIWCGNVYMRINLFYVGEDTYVSCACKKNTSIGIMNLTLSRIEHIHPDEYVIPNTVKLIKIGYGYGTRNKKSTKGLGTPKG